MKISRVTVPLALVTALALTSCTSTSPEDSSDLNSETPTDPAVVKIKEELDAWPEEAANQLANLIADKADSDEYVVFDADNTMYQHDLTEALLAYLENKGVLTRENLDPSLNLIPFNDTADFQESLFSYYYRLCEVGDFVCYPWIAQSFAGITVEGLKGYIDEMLADGGPFPIEYEVDGVPTPDEIAPPKFFPAMQQLTNALSDNGIEVYVVSAANEEAVRAVVSDPQYGYNVAPENVIGVAMLLRDPVTGDMTNARREIMNDTYDPTALQPLVITPYLWSPLTWFEGKAAAIRTYISQWQSAVLIAGDTPVSDGPMLAENVNVKDGGARVFVVRSEERLEEVQELQKADVDEQKRLGVAITGDRNWIYVEPAEIGGEELR